MKFRLRVASFLVHLGQRIAGGLHTQWWKLDQYDEAGPEEFIAAQEELAEAVGFFLITIHGTGMVSYKTRSSVPLSNVEDLCEQLRRVVAYWEEQNYGRADGD